MGDISKNTIENLTDQLDSLSIVECLGVLSNKFSGRVTFSSSFSFEDQLITHFILENALPISLFTLDTGRMFAETYSVWNRTNIRYNTYIKAYFPNQNLLESFVNERGPNSFYESIENRKTCCHIRKVEPLQRALFGNKVWITGLRAEHSTNRNSLRPIEWDAANQIIKYHPLLYWTTNTVREYIDVNHIPYNPLHDRGFVSIGCAPCTRAIKPEEDFRAGRWWWEEADKKKECGLHAAEIFKT